MNLETTESELLFVGSKVTFFSFFNLKIYCFSFLISSLYCSRFVDSDYSLIRAFTLTILALFAKLRVESDYWKHKIEGETVAIMKVLELPPRLSFKRQVNFESLYGICVLFFSVARALITIPKVVKDLLMFPAYLSLSPVANVIFCLYEPARSTKWSLGVFKTFLPSISSLIEREMVKIEWEREDSLFIIVSPICLFFIPILRHSTSFYEFSIDS